MDKISISPSQQLLVAAISFPTLTDDMKATGSNPILLLFLFVSLQTTSPSFCQTSNFPISKWVNDLQEKKDSTIQELQYIGHQLDESDSVSAFRALGELEKSGLASDHYFNAGLFYLK